MTHILAIDQGTTSSRAIVFDADLQVVASAQEEFPQHFPRSGWVEHDPEDIWASVLSTCRSALEKAGLGTRDIAGIGITNQRETTLVWDRETGRAVHNAIVWQDRRTEPFCRELLHQILLHQRQNIRTYFGLACGCIQADQDRPCLAHCRVHARRCDASRCLGPQPLE